LPVDVPVETPSSSTLRRPVSEEPGVEEAADEESSGSSIFASLLPTSGSADQYEDVFTLTPIEGRRRRPETGKTTRPRVEPSEAF
jgi:hypothetical protein